MSGLDPGSDSPLPAPIPPSDFPAFVAKSPAPPFELQIPARAKIASPPPVFNSHPWVGEVHIPAVRGRLVPLRFTSASHPSQHVPAPPVKFHNNCRPQFRGQ